MREWTGREVRSLAYPNGDADARVAAAVGKAGYELAFLTRAGLHRPGASRLGLPRLLVGGYDTRHLFAYGLNRTLFRG